MPTLPGTAQSATTGVKGFDADTPISFAAAGQFFAQGYRFCLRYVGRTAMGNEDLTSDEAEDILRANLALMVVQHVEEEGWSPTGGLGTTYINGTAAKLSLGTRYCGLHGMRRAGGLDPELLARSAHWRGGSGCLFDGLPS